MWRWLRFGSKLFVILGGERVKEPLKLIFEAAYCNCGTRRHPTCGEKAQQRDPRSATKLQSARVHMHRGDSRPTELPLQISPGIGGRICIQASAQKNRGVAVGAHFDIDFVSSIDRGPHAPIVAWKDRSRNCRAR